MRPIVIDAVTKHFADVAALDHVDLTIDPGEHIALLGPSGSGKSTLLRIIAGLDEPDHGHVLIDGAPQDGIRPHQRDIALVFQQYALYPHLTALGNITLGLRRGLGLPRHKAESRARAVAEQLRISDLLDRKPSAMSGGQRQRVSLGRALARRTGIVLLDEPMSGLDAQLRLSLRVEIGRHLRNSGATVIHVTHDQSDAMTTADRVVLLDQGRIHQTGTPRELFEHPADLFVATFLGVPPMNIFEAVPAPNGRAQSVFGLHHWPWQFAGHIGVRPDHLALGGTRPWRFKARVTAVEVAGVDYVVHLTHHDTIVAVRSTGDPPTIDDIVELSCDPSDAHVFTNPDGRRVGSGDQACLHERHPRPVADAL